MCLGNSRKATIFLKAFRDTLGEQWGRELAWKSAPQPVFLLPLPSPQQVASLFTVTFWRMPPKDESGCACCRKTVMQSLVGQF